RTQIVQAIIQAGSWRQATTTITPVANWLSYADVDLTRSLKISSIATFLATTSSRFQAIKSLVLLHDALAAGVLQAVAECARLFGRRERADLCAVEHAALVAEIDAPE